MSAAPKLTFVTSSFELETHILAVAKGIRDGTISPDDLDQNDAVRLFNSEKHALDLWMLYAT